MFQCGQIWGGWELSPLSSLLQTAAFQYESIAYTWHFSNIIFKKKDFNSFHRVIGDKSLRCFGDLYSNYIY